VAFFLSLHVMMVLMSKRYSGKSFKDSLFNEET